MSPVKRLVKAATAPVRGYLNNHFEMVKEEVRHHTPVVDVDVDTSAAWLRVAELENTLAETSLYQARMLARLSEDLIDLAARIDGLERVVRQVASVVAASTVADR